LGSNRERGCTVMKITRSKLKQIIKEELEAALNERPQRGRRVRPRPGTLNGRCRGPSWETPCETHKGEQLVCIEDDGPTGSSCQVPRAGLLEREKPCYPPWHPDCQHHGEADLDEIVIGKPMAKHSKTGRPGGVPLRPDRIEKKIDNILAILADLDLDFLKRRRRESLKR